MSVLPLGEGTAMDADRRERAKSIRAAREWLTGAEVALAGEDDLAGDLKLMLARAELARLAADRRARVRRWAGRLLPPVMVAAAILVWMMWMSPHGEEVATPLPMQTAEIHADVTASTAATVPPPPVEEQRARDAVQTPTVPQMEEVHPSIEESAAQEHRADTVPTHMETPATIPAVTAPPRMPNADMQRLMQVGGKILRE